MDNNELVDQKPSLLFRVAKSTYLVPFSLSLDYDGEGENTSFSFSKLARNFFLDIYSSPATILAFGAAHSSSTTPAESEFDLQDTLKKGLIFQMPLFLVSFFSLPQQFLTKGSILSLGGWNEQSSPLWNCLKFPFIFAFNIIKITTKTAWHIVKIFTEFLPTALEVLCDFGIFKLKSIKTTSHVKKGLVTFGIALLLTGFYLFKIWRLIGRTITSPDISMKTAWETGNQLGGTRGKIVGGLLATVSALFSIAAYVAMFPLLIKAAVVHGPDVISRATIAVTNWMANSPAIAHIGKIIQKIISPFSKLMKKIFRPLINATSSGPSPDPNAAAVLVTGAFAVVHGAKATAALLKSKKEERNSTRAAEASISDPDNSTVPPSNQRSESIYNNSQREPSVVSDIDEDEPSRKTPAQSLTAITYGCNISKAAQAAFQAHERAAAAAIAAANSQLSLSPVEETTETIKSPSTTSENLIAASTGFSHG